MKYIIKNCPLNCNGECPDVKTGYCQDKPDCLLKQIVENLKQVVYACHCDNCDGCGFYEGCSDTECGTYQALKSLELLDIQEIEE